MRYKPMFTGSLLMIISMICCHSAQASIVIFEDIATQKICSHSNRTLSIITKVGDDAALLNSNNSAIPFLYPDVFKGYGNVARIEKRNFTIQLVS